MIPRVFFGWWVALAFAVIVFLSMGIRFTIGPFLKPMVADLGTDRASFSVVVAVALFLYGATGFPGRSERGCGGHFALSRSTGG